MKLKLQFAGWLLALGMCAAMGVPCLAQGPRMQRVQNRPAYRPPKQQARQQQQRRQQGQGQKQQQAERRQNGAANRPPNGNTNHAGTESRPNNNPNRPPSAYTPPAQRKFSDLTPQEQKKIVDNYNRQKNLTPAQQQEFNDRIRNWTKLTPQQKDHIRNDVMPRWRQMPVERRQAIRQRLKILQNMPESARNQHLNDPNFTRGMSEEDKATLKDLSHMHVGGAPDPPNE